MSFSKLIELNMVGDDSKKYKISFVLDRHPMFSVYSMRHGKPFKHEVKVSRAISGTSFCAYQTFNSGSRDHLEEGA